MADQRMNVSADMPLPAWATDTEHYCDPYEPRECMCGLTWPCAIGIALAKLAASEQARERLQAERDEARRIVESWERAAAHPYTPAPREWNEPARLAGEEGE